MKISTKKKIIIIGSGFGGLTVAMRLLANGHKVTLIEKLNQIGGRGRVQKINNFKFDSGPTVITVPQIFEDAFSSLGKRFSDYVALIPIYPYYRIEFSDGTNIDYGTIKDNSKYIEDNFPEDLIGYQKLVKKNKEMYKKGYEELAFRPFSNALSMLRIIPTLIKLRGYKKNYNYISSFIKTEKLRQILTFHPLLIGGNPLTSPALYSLIQHLENEYGIWYPKGGMGSIIEAMKKVIIEAGGQFKLNQNVKSIKVEDGKATKVITDKLEIPADIVISNADVGTTYTKFIDKKWRKKNSDKRYKKSNWSFSLFLIYFGTNIEYPHLEHHTIFLAPNYKKILKEVIEEKTIGSEFLIYLHTPTRTDKSLAPEGHELFYALVPMPNLKSKTIWKNIEKDFCEKILIHLEERGLRDLRKNIVTLSTFTPEDFSNTYASTYGNAFSLEPSLMQSAYFRPHNRSEDIRGLYLVGAGTHPGAGLPGVIASSKITADLIAEDIAKGVL